MTEFLLPPKSKRSRAFVIPRAAGLRAQISGSGGGCRCADIMVLEGVHPWRLEKAGEFPKRVPIGAGRYGWVEAEINAFIEGKIVQRDRALTTADQGGAQ
jgi:Prophage CP4-57 regulatory protein (AlpA)